MNLHDFTRTIVKHAYVSDNSFLYGFTDYYYNYNFVDVQQEMKRDISKDASEIVTNLKNGIDPNTVDGAKICHSFTNEPTMQGTNYHFSNFKIFNNSTELSQKNWV